MIETRSVEEVVARINEYREIRDKYLEDFSKNILTEVATHNYRHICTRLDELSWVLKLHSSGESTNEEA